MKLRHGHCDPFRECIMRLTLRYFAPEQALALHLMRRAFIFAGDGE